MNGILEQLIAALQANTAALMSRSNVNEPSPPMTSPQAQTVLLAPPPPPAALPNVTAEQVTALIQPHIGNEALKAELGVAMRTLGINALPEAQPHQYGALHQAFTAVLAKFGIGGGAPQPQAQTSII